MYHGLGMCMTKGAHHHCHCSVSQAQLASYPVSQVTILIQEVQFEVPLGFYIFFTCPVDSPVFCANYTSSRFFHEALCWHYYLFHC